MKKTSIYVEPNVDLALASLARRRGVTKAELIRQVLRAAIADVARPRIEAIGVGAGPGDVADHVDEYLARTDFGVT